MPSVRPLPLVTAEEDSDDDDEHRVTPWGGTPKKTPIAKASGTGTKLRTLRNTVSAAAHLRTLERTGWGVVPGRKALPSLQECPTGPNLMKATVSPSLQRVGQSQVTPLNR